MIKTLKFLVPEGPPETIEVRPLSGDAAMITWSEPSVSNGQISSYQIYFKKSDSKLTQNSLIRLVVQKDPSRNFVYNLTKLGKEFNIFLKIQLLFRTVNGLSNSIECFNEQRRG